MYSFVQSAHDIRRVDRESVKVFLKSRLYMSFISKQLFIHRLGSTSTGAERNHTPDNLKSG